MYSFKKPIIHLGFVKVLKVLTYFSLLFQINLRWYMGILQCFNQVLILLCPRKNIIKTIFKFIYSKVKLKLNSGLSEKQHIRIENTLEDDGTVNRVSLGWAKLILFARMERIVNCLQHLIGFIFKR